MIVFLLELATFVVALAAGGFAVGYWIERADARDASRRNR